MDPLSLVLWGALLPGVLAALIARTEQTPGVGARAMVIGTLAGLLAMEGLPSLPPTEALDYLPLLALIGLVWGQLEARLLVGAPARLLAGVGLLWPMTAAVRQYTWSGTETMQWIGGLGLGIAALWTLSIAGIQRSAPRRAGIALAVVALSAAVALGGSGSVRYAQLAGIVTAALGGVLAGRWHLDRAALLGVTAPLALVLGALLAVGVLFSDLPIPVAGLLVLAPGGLLLGARGRGLAGPALTILLALVAAGIVLGTPAEPDPYGGYY
jgi:hypothetical protein